MCIFCSLFLCYCRKVVAYFLTTLQYSNNNSASTMVSKLLDTANKIGDDICSRIPSNLKGSPFHCPHYIKKLSHVKHTLYKKIKEFSIDMNNLDEFLELNKEYSDLCEKIIYIKKSIRRNCFTKAVKSVCTHFSNNDSRRGWSGLKKLSKPSYSSSTSPNFIYDLNGNPLVSPVDQLKRFGEHYQLLASDVTKHSLDKSYWENVLDPPPENSTTWNINVLLPSPKFRKLYSL